MVRQITVLDENRVKIGMTFPKRAKQLVSRKRAAWLDREQTEIILAPSAGEADLGVIDLTNSNGRPTEPTPPDIDGRFEDISAHIEDRLEKINADIDEALDDIDIGLYARKREKDRSFIKNAYRETDDIVLGRSPIDIIKRSKRRTRELHAAFSAVLWTGAALVYFMLNYLLGNHSLTLSPANLSGTWLIFVVAAFIECLAELYFCKKELAVLNENIDLRQINPAGKSDFDLFAYRDSLTKKIRELRSGAIWLPLVLLYLFSGYLFGLWAVAWIVFPFGVFLEFLFQFLQKLKSE